MKRGDRVQMVDCPQAELYGGKSWVVDCAPWQNGQGDWLVRLQGWKEGGFPVACLAVVDR